ncbi:Tctex-1 family-domain-containing protein [Blastocladiella britannica]|nr:Tctex-1 family-domain-containing protein [Blastocladiella britannica]
MADLAATTSALAASRSVAGSKTNLTRSSNPNLAAGGGGGPSRPKTVAGPNAGAGGAGLDLSGAGLAGGGGMTAAAAERAAEAGQRVYENTFRLAPEKKFSTEAVKRMAQSVLETRLAKVTYSSDKAAELSKLIAGEIVQNLKGLGLDRYKFIADVSIGEFKGQGIRNTSRALWDPHTDSFASATYKNASLFCVAVVFGVYFE